MSKATAARKSPKDDVRAVSANMHRFAPLAPLLGAIIIILLPELGVTGYWILQIEFISIYMLVVSGTNLTFGYAGELQFSQVFMFALGAYVGAIFAIHVTNDILLALIVSALSASVAGAIVAIPALRVGGWSLAMTSFLLVITIPDLVAIMPKYTGGLEGLVGVPLPQMFGVQLTRNGFYLVIVIAACLWMLVFRNLVTSSYGVLFRTLRRSPVLCRSVGYSSLTIKVLAYIGGAAPAGMAGCLFAFLTEYVSPDAFNITLSIGVVAASIMGGAESIYGAIAGAVFLQLVPQSSLSFQQYALIAYGVFFILAAIVLRSGFAGLLSGLWRRLPIGVANTTTSRRRHAEPLAVFREAAELPSAAIGEHPAILNICNVSKNYDGVQALSDVSLVVRSGEVTALIGSNGSGKTTMLNLICGFATRDSGRLELDGTDLGGMTADEIARRGVRRTFQTPNIPTSVATRDVIASGCFSASGLSVIGAVTRTPGYRRAKRAEWQLAEAIAESSGLGPVLDAEAASLPLGTRRVVEVARALCGSPRVLLLDEPASGLSVEEVSQMGRVLRRAGDNGIAVVVVEHNFGFIREIADVVHVLDVGRLIASGSTAEIVEDEAVIGSYLGY